MFVRRDDLSDGRSGIGGSTQSSRPPGLRRCRAFSHSASPGPFRALAMDDLEQYAGAFLFVLIFARLAREVRGVLQPLARWPPGTSARSTSRTLMW